MNLREVLNIATQIAAGLACAHEAGIIHRDIKKNSSVPGKVYEQQGDTLRALENDEKFLDLPRWITLSTEQNLFDNTILRGLWKNADTYLPDLIDPEPSRRSARLKGE